MSVVKRIAMLEAFLDFMFDRAVMDGGDIDYFDVVEKMESLNLIRSEPYDPKKHGEIDAETGDVIYTKVKA